MDLVIEHGRLADAEQLIERSADARGSEGLALRMLLIPTLVQEGRQDEAERLIEARWRALDARGEGASEQAINLARLHMELRWNVPPMDSVRAYLEQVGRLAPDDDRIWLGKANLAIRAGLYDEAARWIDACLRRRPDDRPVWRARLDWAMRTNRLADARTALKHLPAGPATPTEVHRLSAWFAAACGDIERERRELASLIAEAPEDFQALERFETLEQREATKTVAADLPHRRPEIERDQARYRELYRRNQPARDGEEMARLSERLGQRFEAIVFLTAAIAEEVGRDDLRAPGIGWTKSDTTRRPRRVAACSTGSGSTAAANGRHPDPGLSDDGGKDSASMIVLRAVGIGGVGGRLCGDGGRLRGSRRDLARRLPGRRGCCRRLRWRGGRPAPGATGILAASRGDQDHRRGQQQGESLHRSSSSYEFRGGEMQGWKGERRGPFHSPMPALHINTHPS